MKNYDLLYRKYRVYSEKVLDQLLDDIINELRMSGGNMSFNYINNIEKRKKVILDVLKEKRK